MNYSFDSRRKASRQKIFNRQTLQSLTSDQKIFAQSEFQRIYAQQMSKLALGISHKKKVQENLQTLDQNSINTSKKQFEKLVNKLSQSDRKRQNNIDEKIKFYKLNDQKWKRKMEEIQRKFRSKNRQALQKANQYRHQAEQFWDKKKKKMDTDRSRASLVNFTNSRLQQSKRPNIYQKLPLPKLQKKIKRQISKTLYPPQKLKDIDAEIKKHQEKMQNLRSEKQQNTLKKALEKLDKIQLQRKNKKNLGKVSQPTIAKKVNNQINQSSIRSRSKNTLETSQLRNKQSLDNLIKLHNSIKQQKQHQQFLHRGDILEKSIKRNKKNKILKMIRDKVHIIKIETIRGGGGNQF